MSASDSSKGDYGRLDVDEAILKALSSKPLTARELKDVVTEKTGENERTYYRHLRKLLKQGKIEEVSEKSDGVRLLTKYRLYREQSERTTYVVSISHGLVPWVEGVGYPPERSLLELAAWIKREPGGWKESNSVKLARQCLQYHAPLVPEINSSKEDPDAYAFAWSKRAVEELQLQDRVSSRFFDLRSVHGSVVPDSDTNLSGNCEVFLGVFWTSEKEPHAICVGVCRRDDGSIGVVHVENREGKLEKSWVKGVGRQLGSKSVLVRSYDSLEDESKRTALLSLRKALLQHRLLIPNRYTQLIKELYDYSYMKPSEGYVLALALALGEIDS